MNIATNIKPVNEFGFQLILSESNSIVGVNLLFNKKILIKKRFAKVLNINSKYEEDELIRTIINEYLRK